MRIFSFILILAGLALAGCADSPAKTWSYTPPNTPGGRMCIGQCQEARDYCREDCSFGQRQCVSKVQAQALIDYQKYMSESFQHSNAIDLRARDFERMKPCDDDLKICNSVCESKYRACFKTCGGAVEMAGSCGFFCF